jgi:hypothetical protein
VQPLFAVLVSLQQPAQQEEAIVQQFLGAIVASVQEVLNRQLGDADAAAAVVAAAPTTVTATAQADGTYLYQFTVMLPAAMATAAPQQRVRRLLGGSGGDPFSSMLTDGTLTQKLLESGVGNTQDLINSGCVYHAPPPRPLRLLNHTPLPPPPPKHTYTHTHSALGVAVAVVAPSPSPSVTPTGSGTLTPTGSGTGTGTMTGTPAGTPTATPTKTATGTPTPTGSGTLTPSPTSTATESSSSTETGTPTPSKTSSVTPQGVTATVQLGGLPATAFDDSTGMLKRTAVDNIASALTAGVAAACPACTVRVTRVVNSATGAVVFAGRRLQAAAAYTVSFFVAGAGAPAAAAGINTALVASQLSASLGTTITVTLPSTGGASDSGALSSGVAIGVGVGVAVAVAVLLLAAVMYFRSKRAVSTEVYAEHLPKQPALVVRTAPLRDPSGP